MLVYADGVLTARPLSDRDGIVIWDVRCRHGAGRGADDEHVGSHSFAFVRRGCFVHSSRGVDSVLDPTLAFCINPGDEHRYDHPHGGGDDCTSVSLDAELVASIWGGDPELPRVPVPTPPRVDLEHRLLLAAARSGADPHASGEHALALVAMTLEQADARRVASGRPATARARRALVDGVREALGADPGIGLPELARRLAVSPHHLSRVFRAGTGRTISQHRLRLRVRFALERLADGDGELARLAAAAGFADQSHLTRAVRRETGQTPAILRRALA